MRDRYTFRTLAAALACAAFLYFAAVGPAQPRVSLASAINNGNGGTFTLNSGTIYTGDVVITGATTIFGNNARVELGNDQHITVSSTAIDIQSLNIVHTGTRTSAWAFNLFGSSGGNIAANTIDNFVTGVIVSCSGDLTIAGNTFRNCATGISVSSGFEADITTNTFETTNSSLQDTAILGLPDSFASGTALIDGNIVSNLGGAQIQLLSNARPIVQNNQLFYSGPRGDVPLMRINNTAVWIRSNLFNGGSVGIEATGTSSWPDGPFGPTQRPIEGNTFLGQTFAGINIAGSRAPIIQSNNLQNTIWGIIVDSVPNAPVVRSNTLSSFAVDPGDIFNNHGVGAGIGVWRTANAQVIDNVVTGYSFGVQVTLGATSAEVRENTTNENYFGGVQVTDNSSANVTGNVCIRNVADGIFFGSGSSGSAQFNISNDGGRWAGITAGATGIAVVNGSSANLSYNLAVNNIDQGLAVTEGSTADHVIGNTAIGNGIAGFLIGENSSVRVVADNYFFGHPLGIAANTTNPGLRPSANFVNNFTGNATEWGALLSAGNGLTLLDSLFWNVRSGVGAVQGTSFPLRGNVFAIVGQGAASSSNVVANDNSVLNLGGNTFSGPTNFAFTSNNGPGFTSTSNGDWWGASNGPAPGGSGLVATNISVNAPAANPLGLLGVSDPVTAGSGANITYNFNFPAIASLPAQAGAVRMTTGRTASNARIAIGRQTLTTHAVPLPPNRMPGLFWQIHLPYDLWADGLVTIDLPISPSLIPAGFAASDAVAYRLNFFASFWERVPSVASGSTLTLQPTAGSNPSGTYLIAFIESSSVPSISYTPVALNPIGSALALNADQWLYRDWTDLTTFPDPSNGNVPTVSGQQRWLLDATSGTVGAPPNRLEIRGAAADASNPQSLFDPDLAYGIWDNFGEPAATLTPGNVYSVRATMGWDVAPGNTSSDATKTNYIFDAFRLFANGPIPGQGFDSGGQPATAGFSITTNMSITAPSRIDVDGNGSLDTANPNFTGAGGSKGYQLVHNPLDADFAQPGAATQPRMIVGIDFVNAVTASNAYPGTAGNLLTGFISQLEIGAAAEGTYNSNATQIQAWGGVGGQAFDGSDTGGTWDGWGTVFRGPIGFDAPGNPNDGPTEPGEANESFLFDVVSLAINAADIVTVTPDTDSFVTTPTNPRTFHNVAFADIASFAFTGEDGQTPQDGGDLTRDLNRVELQSNRPYRFDYEMTNVAGPAEPNLKPQVVNSVAPVEPLNLRARSVITPKGPGTASGTAFSTNDAQTIPLYHTWFAQPPGGTLTGTLAGAENDAQLTHGVLDFNFTDGTVTLRGLRVFLLGTDDPNIEY